MFQVTLSREISGQLIENKLSIWMEAESEAQETERWYQKERQEVTITATAGILVHSELVLPNWLGIALVHCLPWSSSVFICFLSLSPHRCLWSCPQEQKWLSGLLLSCCELNAAWMLWQPASFLPEHLHLHFFFIFYFFWCSEVLIFKALYWNIVD